MRRYIDPLKLLKRPIHPLVLAGIFLVNAIVLFPLLNDPVIQVLFTLNVGTGLYAFYFYLHVLRPAAKLLREAATAPIEPAHVIPANHPHHPSTGHGNGPKPPPNR